MVSCGVESCCHVPVFSLFRFVHETDSLVLVSGGNAAALGTAPACRASPYVAGRGPLGVSFPRMRAPSRQRRRLQTGSGPVRPSARPDRRVVSATFEGTLMRARDDFGASEYPLLLRDFVALYPVSSCRRALGVRHSVARSTARSTARLTARHRSVRTSGSFWNSRVFQYLRLQFRVVECIWAGSVVFFRSTPGQKIILIF